MPSERALRMAAAASFENAEALFEEAGLLSEHTKFARAAALAVIAAEEFAKTVIYLVAALMSDERGVLPPRPNWHEMKHRAASPAEAAWSTNEEWWAVQRSEGYPSSVGSRLQDMAVLLCESGLGSLTNRHEVKTYYRELRQHHKGEPSRLVSLIRPGSIGKDIFLSSREPDLKNAALYVDLENETVFTQAHRAARRPRHARGR